MTNGIKGRGSREPVETPAQRPNKGSSGPTAAGGYAGSAGCAPRPCPRASDLKGE